MKKGTEDLFISWETYTPGAAASIDADEFELICHSHSHSLVGQQA